MLITLFFDTTEDAEKALDKLYFSKWKNTCGFDIGGPQGVDAIEVRLSRVIPETEAQEMTDFAGAKSYTYVRSR